MWKSPRLEMYDSAEADGSHQLELDSLDDMRCNALLWSTRYLQTMRRYHDRNIQSRSFNIGDMVLRRIQDEIGLHKLNSRWEGPFIVTKVTEPGSYRLIYADGLEVPNSWNIEHLRKFYPWAVKWPPPKFQISIKKHGLLEFNSSPQDSFRSRNSIGYLEYQPFFVHSKSKARRIE